jgi:nucleotide-binding universal stress UspA family protein
MADNILVSLDITEPEEAKKLLQTAEKLATLYDGDLHAVAVIPSYSMPIVGSYFKPEDEKAVLEKARETLRLFLKENATRTDHVKGHIAHGTIYDEIVKAADKLNCQLIVLGAHRPELKDYLLGPNAARVVRHAKQSVYVVRD